MPIYWGNPYVAEEYNPEAFINCNDYNSIDDVVRRVKEIDEDDNLWLYMVNQPWQTERQREVSKNEYRRYKNFMTKIFTQPLNEAKRRPEGTWVDVYLSWFLYGIYFIQTRLKYFRLFHEPWRIFRSIYKLLNKLPVTDIKDFFKDEGEKI